MIQSIVATLIVLAAATWLLRRIFLTIRAAVRSEPGRLGGCGNCSHNPANEKPTVITLGTNRPSSSTKAGIR